MENNQALDINEEELQAMLESGEIVLQDQEDESSDKIGFDVDVIASYEEVSAPVQSEFDKGVYEASKYIGQFAALINSGMDSDSAIVCMSWIREDKLNQSNIDGQIELAKQESIKIKRESL